MRLLLRWLEHHHGRSRPRQRLHQPLPGAATAQGRRRLVHALLLQYIRAAKVANYLAANAEEILSRVLLLVLLLLENGIATVQTARKVGNLMYGAHAQDGIGYLVVGSRLQRVMRSRDLPSVVWSALLDVGRLGDLLSDDELLDQALEPRVVADAGRCCSRGQAGLPVVR